MTCKSCDFCQFYDKHPDTLGIIEGECEIPVLSGQREIVSPDLIGEDCGVFLVAFDYA